MSTTDATYRFLALLAEDKELSQKFADIAFGPYYDLSRVKEEDQTPEICWEAVSHSYANLGRVKNQTRELCLMAIHKGDGGGALYHIRDQTPELCEESVRLHPFSLMYVRDQTPALCLLAVKQSGLTLQFVHDQTPDLCLAAVSQDGRALQYVKEQTPEICAAAVRQWAGAIQYVKQLTPEIEAGVALE